LQLELELLVNFNVKWLQAGIERMVEGVPE
jgi:hypothetical protein